MSPAAVPPSLHRAYFRRRANPRLALDTATMVRRHPCAAGSRWNRFALTAADVGRSVSFAPADASSSSAPLPDSWWLSLPAFALSVDGVVRTEVSASAAWNLSSLAGFATNVTRSGVPKFALCSVDEIRGGEVTMGAGCDAVVENPPVVFNVGAPAPSRVLFRASGDDNNASFSDLAFYRPGNTFDRFRYSPPEQSDVALLDADVQSCLGAATRVPGDTIFAVAAPSSPGEAGEVTTRAEG